MRAMDRPSQNHRDPWFAPFFKQVLEDSKVREMKRRERGEQPGRERSALVHLSTSSPLTPPSPSLHSSRPPLLSR